MNNLSDIDKSIFHYINKASIDLLCYFDQLLIDGGFDINSYEWILLSHILEHPGKNQNWYANHLLKDKTTTMRLVDHLENKNLITRVPDSEDRRQNLLFVTPYGNNLVIKTIPFINQAFQTIFTDIDPQHIEITVTVLQKMITKLMERK